MVAEEVLVWKVTLLPRFHTPGETTPHCLTLLLKYKTAHENEVTTHLQPLSSLLPLSTDLAAICPCLESHPTWLLGLRLSLSVTLGYELR